MILVDTSVWIDHLREERSLLAGLLIGENVVLHPFVLGELALGTLKNRRNLLSLLEQLPQASVATESEVLFFIQ